MILINETPVRQGDQYVTAYEAEATTGAVEYTFPELQATLTIFNFGLRGVIAVANGERKIIDPNDSETFKHTSSVTINTLVGSQRFRLEGRKQVEQIVAGTVDNVARESATESLTKIGALSELATANKDSLVAAINDAASQFSINVKNYGVNGDGTNETVPLKNAFSIALSAKKALDLHDGTYYVNSTSDIEIPSLVGRGATVILEGNFSFMYGNSFFAKGVTFKTNNIYPLASMIYNPILKHKASGQKNILLDSVRFEAVLPVSDGTQRAGRGFITDGVENIILRDVSANGFVQGIVVTGNSSMVRGNGLIALNTELAVYISGSSPNSTDMTYANDIIFNNVIHKLTSAQQANRTKIEGSDTFLIEKAQHVTISDVNCENVIERVIYANCVNNLKTHGFNLYNTNGIKFVGKHKNSTSLNNHADGLNAENIVMRISTLDDNYMFNLGFAHNVNIKNCHLYGNGKAHSFVSITPHIENLEVSGCTIEGVKRAPFDYVNPGIIAGNPPLGIPDIAEGDFPAYMKNVTIRDNILRDVCIVDYHMLRVQDSGTLLTSGIGGYRYENLLVKNNFIDNFVSAFSESTGTSVEGCRGILDLKDCNGLKIIDNRVFGYNAKTDANGNRLSFPFQIGANCYKVVVKHEETLRSSQALKKFVFGNMKLSPGSEIKFKIIDRNGNFQDVGTVRPNIYNTDVEFAIDINTSFSVSGEITVTAAGTGVGVGDIVSLVGFDSASYTLPALIGSVEIDADSGDYGRFTFTKTGTVTKQAHSAASFENTYSATTGKMSVYKDGGLPRFLVRDKMGASSRKIIKYNVTTL